MKEVKTTHLKAYRLNKNLFLLVSHPHYPSLRTKHPCHMNALLVLHPHYPLALHHHPGLPSKKGRWLDGIAKPLFYIIFIL